MQPVGRKGSPSASGRPGSQRCRTTCVRGYTALRQGAVCNKHTAPSRCPWIARGRSSNSFRSAADELVAMNLIEIMATYELFRRFYAQVFRIFRRGLTASSS